VIVVTLARKPVPTTVARNVLTHGVGALNIDATRLKLPPGAQVLHDRGSDPANRRGEVGKDFGFARVSRDKMQQAQRESIARTNALGRWPANLIFAHRPGCKQGGVRAVQGSNRASTSLSGASMVATAQGGYGHTGHGPIMGYANEEGVETVTDWECTFDCPVANLERQSLEGGIHAAGGATDGEHCPSTGAFGPVPISPAGMPSYRYGDKGGASRFFVTVGGQR
jgi:hypothetical protein